MSYVDVVITGVDNVTSVEITFADVDNVDVKSVSIKLESKVKDDIHSVVIFTSCVGVVNNDAIVLVSSSGVVNAELELDTKGDEEDSVDGITIAVVDDVSTRRDVSNTDEDITSITEVPSEQKIGDDEVNITVSDAGVDSAVGVSDNCVETGTSDDENTTAEDVDGETTIFDEVTSAVDGVISCVDVTSSDDGVVTSGDGVIKEVNETDDTEGVACVTESDLV